MKQITVISGKGGTGKTTVTAALAALTKNAVLADCDVDAPDLHLLLKPDISETEKFFGMRVPVKDEAKCTSCGKCREVCRFGAIEENFLVDALKCEGCGACAFICPQNAFTMRPRESGELYYSKTRLGPFVHALLKMGEEASGKLVTAVRKKAREVAEKNNAEIVLVDGSPGIGCPVIASIGGVDLTLIVTEPSLAGAHDLKRILKVTRHFKIPSLVVVNKHDLNERLTRQIEESCREEETPVIGKIPYDTVVTQAMLAEQTIIEFQKNGAISRELRAIWQTVSEFLAEK